MPSCPFCQKETLELTTFGSAIVYLCPQCRSYFNDTLQSKSLVELVYETEPEGQEIIRRVSRESCQSIIQYLRIRISKDLVDYGVIPLVWGTTARMLYSPLSDIDIVFVIPDNNKEKSITEIKAFEERVKREEIRLKRLISRTTFKKTPPMMAQETISFSTISLLESNLHRNLQRGILSKAKPFQPPQVILLTSAFPLKNAHSFAALRDRLHEQYMQLADSKGVLLERLIVGLYLYIALAHIYYGRKDHIRLHSLPPTPTFLPSESMTALFTEGVPPDFKSLDFREWEYSNANPKAIDNGTKVLYRVLCDSLISATVLCTESFEDLAKYETFDIASKGEFFQLTEKRLFFKVQKWRLGDLPTNFNRLWQVATLLSEIILSKVLKYGLETEIELARHLFLESPAVDYMHTYLNAASTSAKSTHFISETRTMALFMVKKRFFEQFKSGKKGVELRNVQPQWKNSKVGDEAVLLCGNDRLKKTILKIHRGSLVRIFKHVDYKRIFPEAKTVFQAARETREIYGDDKEFMAFELV